VLTWERDADLTRGDAHTLYDGTIGPGLFLAALAAVTDERMFRESAMAALAPALDWIEAAGDEGEMTVGGCTGLGSIVHGLARAGELLDEARLLDGARRAAALIDLARISSDRLFDIVDGAAGGRGRRGRGSTSPASLTVRPASRQRSAGCRP
jgi:lantibiotic modifying enzyme